MSPHKKTKNRTSFFFSFSLLIFYAVISCALIFSSCKNFFENEVTEIYEEKIASADNQGGAAEVASAATAATQAEDQETEPIIVTGHVQINGAVPEEIADAGENQPEQTEELSRAAVSTYEASEVEYFVTAVSGSKTAKGTFTSGTSNFSILLIPGLSWDITCGLKKRDSGSVTGDTLFSQTKTAVNPASITTANPLQFFPTPDVSGGATSTGEIELSMTIDYTITSVRLTCYGANKDYWPFTEATVSDTTATIQTDSAVAGKESVRSGAYEVVFAFYKADGSLAYSSIQTINVCKGLKTKKWVSSGGQSPIDSSGLFNVTAAKIAEFATTNFYVGPTGASNAAAPSDTNSGSHKAPYATLGRALTQIANNGISTNDYTIHISGEQKVAADATEGFVVNGLDSKMNSLIITGLNNNTTDILDGDGRFCTLKIDSSKNVTVQNLTITHGYMMVTAENGGYGGGVQKYGNGHLTLDNCTITHNTAVKGGAGFCSFENAGDCTIKNCTIESNTATESNGGGIYSRAKTDIINTTIIKNSSGASGGGIFLRDKAVTITGSQTLISENTAVNYGGGINVYSNGSLSFSDGIISKNTAQLRGGGINSDGSVTMTSGTITGNKSVGTAEDNTCGGGGVSIKSTFEMKGGLIKDNSANVFGGGVFLFDSAAKLFISGNAVIGDISQDSPAESDNDKHSNSAGKGGGIFNRGKLYAGYIDESTPDPSFTGGIGYNYASIHGGGIYSVGNGTAEVYIYKTKIRENASETFGGGIDIYNGTIEINNSIIEKNKGGKGGGINLGRSDGSPVSVIKNTNIINNISTSRGGGVFLLAGSLTLADVQITDNHSDGIGGGVFLNSDGIKVLTLGTSTAESIITIKNNTEGASTPYTKSNVYLNLTTDNIIIAGALSTESEVGITRSGIPKTDPFTSGFKLRNPSITPDQIFTSDDNSYEVGAVLLTGEAKLRLSGAAGPVLTWFYAVGDACMALSSEEMERIGVPEYHDASNGTTFTLNRTGTGPFTDPENNNTSIFTGNVYMENPASGVQVTAGTETTDGIPYTIAAGEISDDMNMYILLDFAAVYLDPDSGDDDNGGWNKDIPVKTVAQAKQILIRNTKANPAIMVMNTISSSADLNALADITTATYNNAVIKPHSTFADPYIISVGSAASASLSNVTIEEGTVYTKGSLTLSGSQYFTDDLCFYIDNSSEAHPLILGSGFTNSTSDKAKIKLAKTFAASSGQKVLDIASGSSVDLSIVKAFFELSGTDSDLYEITNDGKISPLPSGGNIYTAMDYTFTLAADKSQVTKGEDSVITITPTVKRREANGSQTRLYFNPDNQKLYTDSVFETQTLAGGDNAVTWSATLMCGSYTEYSSLAAGTTANQFTIPALAWEDNYTLNVTATYMGVTCDASFAVECVEHAFNATAYTDNGDGTVYFGDWPQSAKASGVTVNEAVSLEIGALTYYLGSDNAWYAKLDTDYFKVEPVKWKILTSDYNGTGYKLLFATKILEGRPYDASSTKYDTSAIRAYLNGDFKNTVFSTAALQSIIQTVEVDNSARSTNPNTNPTYFNSGTNPYACDNTNDQIFLLSLQEITTAAYGFNTDPTAIDGNRNYSPTGYALKTGAYSGGWWMTRSPDTGSGYLRYSNQDGRANGGSNQWKTNSVGMIPALCVTGN
ncbi:DUF6273 domain-containing protein [Treponema bryantii]|uniref:DUF6273 domain-containing protein n=1 Tax=Treponema bryantii TaxID=163 RepID=UPI0003B4C336|nr:DUF6273 domain-containing protein [Treponema bryantii]